ncbi:DUF6232 family protein [Streptomyces sp. NPDC007369]|uniref:DUF6232 family protein n=1 Tax=Streptomyces sp. NPDC007369 TaxID=3154589 RepID=UPI0033DF9DE6
MENTPSSGRAHSALPAQSGAAPTAAPGTPPTAAPGTPPAAAPVTPPNSPPSAPPPPPSPPRPVAGGLELRISKRILWVGGAAYPLENIARVYTFTLHPRRKDATVHFLKNLCLILSVAFALTILAGLTSLANREASGTILQIVWLGAVAALIYCIVQWITVLSAASYYVLAVETSGPSIAVVTSSDHHHLHRLVGQITHAIDHPDTELYGVRVDTITISPKNYYFGDNVNMYGGSGNVGIGTR